MSYYVLVIVECSEMTCRVKLLEAHTACMSVLIIRLLKLTGPDGLFQAYVPMFVICNMGFTFLGNLQHIIQMLPKADHAEMK